MHVSTESNRIARESYFWRCRERDGIVQFFKILVYLRLDYTVIPEFIYGGLLTLFLHKETCIYSLNIGESFAKKFHTKMCYCFFKKTLKTF